MRKKPMLWISASLIVISSMAFCVGKIQPPVIATVPQILVDVSDEGVIIYVHGISDYKYSNMSAVVKAGNESQGLVENESYALYFTIEYKNFTINITVWDNDKHYVYQGLIGVEDVYLYIEEYRSEGTKKVKVDIDTLPYKSMLWEVKK